MTCILCNHPIEHIGVCYQCCERMGRQNRLDDWGAIPPSERGNTSRQLTDAVIETMRAMAPDDEWDQ